MLTWKEAYARTVEESSDFRMLFGRRYTVSEFRYYAHALKFESIPPALLCAAVTTPNTGSASYTKTNIAAPVTNIVPGDAVESLISFPAGAVILGVTSGAIMPQRTSGAFKYGPTMNRGKRDLYLLDLEFVDTSDIVGQNPIPELITSPNSATQTAPPILADALMGSGFQDVMPGRELLVAPGLGIIVRARSMVLPTENVDDSAANANPNLSIHLVFHCMIPGVVRRKPAN